MEHLIQYFAPVFFLVYMLLAFVLPSIRTYRSTGINPLTFGRSSSLHDYSGRMFKLVLSCIPIVVVFHLVGKRLYQYLLPADYLHVPVVQVTGMVLCLLSLIWTLVAQWHMGNSWRIGIDEKNRSALVTGGLFKVSRNPIFLGMNATLIGFFLVLPNALTLAVLAAGSLLIQIQIRLEEEFLYREYGQEYESYMKRTRRLL